jgi:hypothetical protein
MAKDYEDLLDAGQAAQYLAEKWGMESYSTEAFKMLRHRRSIEPAIPLKNASLWRKADLDLIPKPDRSKPRPRRKKTEVAGDGRSVMLMELQVA